MDLPVTKLPPRYVPTLTEVVPDVAEGELPALAPALAPTFAQTLAPEPAPDLHQPLQVSALPEPGMPQPKLGGVRFAAAGLSSRFPLAEAVLPSLAEQEPEPEPSSPLDAAAWAQLQMQAEEGLVQRLLERVERVLDQRLRESIAQVVQEQTRSVTLRLQEELESVVRQTVQEALAQERAPQGSHGAEERR